MKLSMIYVLLISHMMSAQVSFMGLIEQSSINKNTFLCPASASDGVQGCKDTQAAAHGFDISGGKTMQFCNNQQYWLQQEAAQAQYISQVRNYTGSSLQTKLKQEGWKAMGGYCIVITTDPLVTNFVMPTVTAGVGQTKVVVQLWYNGSSLIQLWSQDAQVFSEGQSFQVIISSQSDDRLATLVQDTAKSASMNSWVSDFLSKMDIQPNNRMQSDYSDAVGSPRYVRLSTNSQQ